ncbi:hypothetical protein WALSEDRAFT_44505 [Wallemia mellicola CBS 633.66]|uniref:DNA repair protein RAD5 n=1 Tax=Wallemia mellicola (strain ATCC MYA-4683 / CBS 633.66) TaxID=671144 RepID=I4YFM6_WALMC|nr:hypothetical protein WALSEDRAFT_44505 [Wallemia mellicola CBS 633.66]EIM22768.1 hypothetical protein WALSEDRAFT_44505 [Wallemia mellicola CBS 633.66]|eukprot:XP_006957425.1 hypothetical protein WALSEDRAFT_44505 [Wallemia mellicola CBS 633.66]
MISGWSTVNGKAYISSGEQVIIERDKGVKTKVAKSESSKQTTLKGFAAKSSRKSENTVMRFRNTRGFEVGRLPSNHSSYLSKLIDKQVIELTGIVIDCEDTLRSGDTIVLSLQVYLHPNAFTKKTDNLSGSNKVSQSQETEQEKQLSDRRDALMKIFQNSHLEPVESNDITRKHRKQGTIIDNKSQVEHFKQAASQVNKSDKVNKKDSNVINIDDSSDEDCAPPIQKTASAGSSDSRDDENAQDKVNDEQLSVVYSRAGNTGRNLQPIDPPDSFHLTLRNYQREALSWMTSMESGSNEPHAQVLHPLWEKYRYRNHSETNGEPDYFYFNPYSGELSTIFPSASKTLRGGIEGDEMGMGKTIMMTALMHHNKRVNMSWHKQQHISTSGKQQTLDTIKTNKPVEIDQSDSDEEYKLTKSQENRDDEDEKPKKRRKQEKSTKKTAKKVGPARQPGGFKALSDSTLIVVPMSLLGQWRDEIERCSVKGTIRTIMYYGDNRGNLEKQLKMRAREEDKDGNVIDYSNAINIVITSYGVLISEYQAFSKHSDEPVSIPTVFDFYWHRVVLDEAHHIKNRSTLNAKAAFEIAAYRRWALTGTPIVNRLEDLYSLLKYLKVEPWSDFTFFKSFVTAPFANQDPKAIELIQVIMSSCLLRREKNMKDSDGKPIVTLPKKFVNIVKLEFSPEERQIYNAIYKKAKRKFDALSHKGMLLKNYSNIFAMLLRLRQAALHPFLVTSGGNNKENDSEGVDEDDGGVTGIDIQSMIAKYAAGGDSNYAQQVLNDLAQANNNDQVDEEENECPICFENMSIPVLLPCMHKSCKQCVLEYFDKLEDKGEMTSCPTCRVGPIRTDQLLEVVYGEPTSQNDQVVRLRKAHNFQTSAKLRALTEHLNQLRKNEGNFKAVVFSQFTSFLDLVEDSLQKEDNFKYLRLDGSTSQKNREIVLNELDRYDGTVILLISLRAGGVGLNLTSANRVFMMDVWWNEAIEKQAIDRVHRIGQEKDVHVVRFCIEDTIEDRVMHIQKRKSALVDNALGGKSSEENRQERIENLKLIFSQ